MVYLHSISLILIKNLIEHYSDHTFTRPTVFPSKFSVPSIIWFHAEKRSDGLFYDKTNPSTQDITELMSSEVGAVTEELVDVPDFLNDFTMINITDEDCVGVQVDPLDFQNVSLVVVDCSSIALVFC